MTHKYILFTILMVSIGGGILHAQTGVKSPSDQHPPIPQSELPFPGITLKAGLNEGNYLAPLLEFRRREAEYLSSMRWRGPYLDMVSYANSFVGDYTTAISYFDQQQRPLRDVPESAAFLQYRSREALGSIGKIADSQQVMMINETHHYPIQRAFATRLLPLLYAKGFRYLALEALPIKDEEINKRKHLHRKYGLYTNEPVFGDMIRVALRLGFKVIPYEQEDLCQAKPDSPRFCQNERERVQAQNIYDRILRSEPQAKILVYGGYGHIMERWEKDFSPMAAHFKNISKIDPFTIDQVEMSDFTGRSFQSPVYRHVVEKGFLKRPTVFQNRDGVFWNTGAMIDGVDLKVFHPLTLYRQGRPEWMQMGGMRKPLIVFGKGAREHLEGLNPSVTNPLLIQAFPAGEDADTVPADQLVVGDKVQSYVLLLRKGQYSIRVGNASGRMLKQYEVSVK